MAKTQMPVPRRAAACGITFRSASEADLPLLSDIYASTRAEEVAATGWTAKQQHEFLQMQSDAQDDHYKKHYPDALWLIIEQDGTPIGRLYLEDWTRELRIIDIALLSDRRSKGIGAAILQDLMDRAAGLARSVSIHVEKNNPAMSLYLRLGFLKVEDKGVYDLMEWHPARGGRN